MKKIRAKIRVRNWNDSSQEYYAFPIRQVGDQTFCVVFYSDDPLLITGVGAWLVHDVKPGKMETVELEMSRSQTRKAIKFIFSY